MLTSCICILMACIKLNDLLNSLFSLRQKTIIIMEMPPNLRRE